MSEISAKILAHSKNAFGDELVTYLVTFPRFILAEGKTHRVMSGMLEEMSIGLNDEPMFSKNSASSRAIPFNKMLESVTNNPFIPIAWQKEHKGMQGMEYITDEEDIRQARLGWLGAKDKAIQHAIDLASNVGITKQIANRLLEPFMWHTVIITTGKEGLENFFNLRCPKYEYSIGDKRKYCRSWKDYVRIGIELGMATEDDFNHDYLWKAQFNRGQAEIHMMALAEAMWDAKNESEPEILKPGQWHIPYRKEIVEQFGVEENEMVDVLPDVPLMTLISSVMCARASYTVTGVDLSEWTVSKYITKALELANADPLHASPFEHCNRLMNYVEYESFIRGKIKYIDGFSDKYQIEEPLNKYKGWCRNFKGFIQLRHIIEENKVSS